MVSVLGSVLALVSLFICLKAEAIGTTLGVLDSPESAARKHHTRVTPLVGGLAVILPVVVMALYRGAVTGIPMFVAYPLVLCGFLVLGLLDDRRHLPATLRLGVAILLTLIGIAMFPPFEVQFLRFSFLDVPIFTNAWGVPFTVLCLVGLQNAVNMADGKNGLVIGLCLIWTIVLFPHAPQHLYPVLATLGLGLGITLIFNLKGYLFLGDAGAYGLSVAIGLLALYIYNVNFVAVSADMVALWFVIPVVDCIRLMLWRSLKGRSPFSPDRDHLHHVLLRFMPWDKALCFYLGMVFFPCLLAMILPELTLLWALCALIVYLAVLTGARLLQPDHGITPHSSS